MRRVTDGGTRHFSEEELLMHLLGEVLPEEDRQVSQHLEGCQECSAFFQELADLRETVLEWGTPEGSPAAWEQQRTSLLAHFRELRDRRAGGGFLARLDRAVHGLWQYAVDNPLPTLGYIAAALAFASERTITVFRLDRVLPGTSEVLQILKQAF